MSRVTFLTLALLVAALGVAIDAPINGPVSAGPAWQPGEPLVDVRDGQQYRTVVIGSQVWMAENLNIGSLVASTAAGSIMKDNGVIEKYCWENDERNCDGDDGRMKRGGFYEWQEAVDQWSGQPSLPVTGICPAGWHVPAMDEWNMLLDGLGGSTAYEKLIVGGGSGFDAELTGYRCTMTGGFRPSPMWPDYRAYFWTANQSDSANAPVIEVGAESQQVFSFRKSLGLAIRCLWDGDQDPTATPTATEPPDVTPSATSTSGPTTATPTESSSPTSSTPAATATPTATEVTSHLVYLPLLKKE